MLVNNFIFHASLNVAVSASCSLSMSMIIAYAAILVNSQNGYFYIFFDLLFRRGGYIM